MSREVQKGFVGLRAMIKRLLNEGKDSGEFAETQVAPRVAEMEKTGEVSDALVKAMGAAEMMVITIL